jgi:2-dehydro-3-deoxyphosphooctonate aldolase (KDO 8-P synthase)
MLSNNELYAKIKKGNFLLAGPCAIESEKLVMQVAEEVKKISEDLEITYIFKSSFDKANRTSLSSFRGPGLDEGLKILEKVKQEFNLPIVTDIHESHQAKAVSEVADILQIPAFLCRQTDLLVAAAKTDKIINIKKAQFLDGKDMYYPTQKVKEAGNNKIMLTERGTLLGLGRLVVDFTQIVDMKEFGYPVVMDVTHSTQRPGGGATSGGNPHYAPYIAKAAKAVGVDGYFMEVHPNPKEALSDGSNMLDLNEFKKLLLSLY